MSSGTFFFYDLETSGVNPRNSRIMQFAGQRVDMDLNPVDEPYNVLVSLTDDILPDPDAILITGITPQKTLAEGLTEAEFVKLFYEQINKPNTIFVGFNSIRFDDEFMRFLFWRNLHDSYQWQWKNGSSRWDLLDVSRMTRALRPEGINWPFESSGKPTNRLEFLSSVNNLEHSNAHDALSDVNATIALAKLIRLKQPKLFDYLLKLRDKKEVQKFVENNEIFVYSSGKYPGEYEKTAVVSVICPHPEKNSVLVYDLRHDPSQYVDKSPEQLAELWRWKKDSSEPRLPVKSLQFNHCPALAPLGVVDDECKKRLKIDLDQSAKNLNVIKKSENFIANLQKAVGILNNDRNQQLSMVSSNLNVDSRLYDGFINDSDRSLLDKLRAGEPNNISDYVSKVSDERLKMLIPLYKARNYANLLSSEELEIWEQYKKQALLGGEQNSRFAKFGQRLSELSVQTKLSEKQQYLLTELQLYAESIMPDIG